MLDVYSSDLTNEAKPTGVSVYVGAKGSYPHGLMKILQSNVFIISFLMSMWSL